MAEIDEALPGGGLLPGGLHELAPETARDQGAALGFALALLARRLGYDSHPNHNDPHPNPPPCRGRERLRHRSLPPERGEPEGGLRHDPLGRRRRPGLLLWAASDALWREHGRPYGPGLGRFGIDAASLIVVEARHARDLAWALEEGIKSRAVTAVLGQVEAPPPLVTRRLALAAKACRCPCLLVPAPRMAGLAPVLTRWRIAAAPSAPHPFDPAAPGASRWHIALERCRWGTGGQTWTVEWSDDAYRFHLAAPMADRAAEAGETRERVLLRA